MSITVVVAQRAKEVTIKNSQLQLTWAKDADKQYQLTSLILNKGGGQKIALPIAKHQRTVLYSSAKPASDPVTLKDQQGRVILFPDTQYRYVTPIWKQATSPVSMNVAGEVYTYGSQLANQKDDGVDFRQENKNYRISESWILDKEYPNDICVVMTMEAKVAGYYAMATPSLTVGNPDDFQWGVIPGMFQGSKINPDFVRAYAYGHGIPDRPVVVRERTTSTLASLLTLASGVTVATIAEPGLARDPWPKDKRRNDLWQLGLSMMNRQGELTPTLYYPVLGEEGSYMQPGEKRTFSFRYTIQNNDWYSTLHHVINDVYHFDDFLKLKQTEKSLSDRIYRMYGYLLDEHTSKWNTQIYENKKIGAQDYLGGVYGSDKDAMKNSDYGAMWMLGKLTGDQKLLGERLPQAADFKMMQQQRTGDFFLGAAAGQYYLYKSKRFAEEWGPYSEPIGTTYYMMMDMGNIFLFESHRVELKKEIRAAADWLLSRMKNNGQWEVAYDNKSAEPIFTDIEDLRPTFYGLYVAYKVLNEEKYRQAAIKGADWYIENAVRRGWFLGVCGDTRFAPDFATIQAVQALLDIYDLTGDTRYRKAAHRLAQFYVTSIYTYPIPSQIEKTVNGISRKDWEISQVGLSFEHGGTIGSANHHGPILLASHAGLFVRLFAETGDSLFVDMARAATWGRDAFVDETTGVASYYWDAMNRGAGPFPHHAWWQIGWIMDYLLSEATLRTQGKVVFPRGFITPKVGPHQSYGHAPGRIFGQQVDLVLRKEMISLDNPQIEYITARSTDQKQLYVILLNNSMLQQMVDIDGQLIREATARRRITVLNAQGKTMDNEEGATKIILPPVGAGIVRIDL
ncbi:glycoside hydrolase family protein [Sphingobacterium tabacisoli]|uniref:glycerophosphoryl diester phosphodiesterase n=1 Tax=Sphingobacterium tabacisoli TaxID=2044855 RepID=UPI001AEEF0AA|nr:glycerophosphoryl diester phosphodiesterase [Sphingobacterium tabacisoli]